MKANDLPDQVVRDPATGLEASELLAPLLRARRAEEGAASGFELQPVHGVHRGELLALREGAVPLVQCPAILGTQAVAANSTVDLHAAHIGRAVLLAFEGGDARLPIVVGVLRESAAWPLADSPAQVEVDADGQRLVVSAKEQLVLRCGKASITLTKAGKVTIEGSYVSSRSTGVNRVKGGSVQLN